MSRIITFLGDGSRERTTLAIAASKLFAKHSQRVLLVTSTNPSAEMLLGTALSTHPQSIDDYLQVVQLQSTALLEQTWEELKQLVAAYLPDALSERIYPGELIFLPGFDSLLAFNALRRYYLSGDYDAIVYDGQGNLETLRMLGIPGALDWYFYRFGQVFEEFDIGQIAAAVGGPMAAAFVQANVDRQKVKAGLAQIRDWIEPGIAIVGDARKLTAYLVTSDRPEAIADACWLWGSAQQINLTVSGVLAYQSDRTPGQAELEQAFAPLAVHVVPALTQQNWDAIIQALPDFNASILVPQPVKIDLAQRQVRAFLPGFNKKQVKLTQYRSEIIVEAGDQRRRIVLPPELKGQSIRSGKFEEPFLVISF